MFRVWSHELEKLHFLSTSVEPKQHQNIGHMSIERTNRLSCISPTFWHPSVTELNEGGVASTKRLAVIHLKPLRARPNRPHVGYIETIDWYIFGSIRGRWNEIMGKHIFLTVYPRTECESCRSAWGELQRERAMRSCVRLTLTHLAVLILWVQLSLMSPQGKQTNKQKNPHTFRLFCVFVSRLGAKGKVQNKWLRNLGWRNT